MKILLLSLIAIATAAATPLPEKSATLEFTYLCEKNGARPLYHFSTIDIDDREFQFMPMTEDVAGTTEAIRSKIECTSKGNFKYSENCKVRAFQQMMSDRFWAVFALNCD